MAEESIKKRERQIMKIKLIRTVAALASILVVSLAGQPSKSYAADMELVIGTGNIKGKLFAAGNAISIASALHAKGIKIFNYATKGGKDNIKRITKKKKAINLALVTSKDLAKAKAKQIKKLSGLMAIGSLKGKQILLIVRNKAPKKVSKTAYAAAISEVMRILHTKKAKNLIKAEWNNYAPASAVAVFKKAGVRLNKAAAK